MNQHTKKKDAKKFPFRLFVKIEQPDDTPYFVAQDDLTGMVEVGETVKVAIYQLVEFGDIEGVIKTRGISA
jgi:predicted RNase H-like HicB family nuclease